MSRIPVRNKRPLPKIGTFNDKSTNSLPALPSQFDFGDDFWEKELEEEITPIKPTQKTKKTNSFDQEEPPELPTLFVNLIAIFLSLIMLFLISGTLIISYSEAMSKLTMVN